MNNDETVDIQTPLYLKHTTVVVLYCYIIIIFYTFFLFKVYKAISYQIFRKEIRKYKNALHRSSYSFDH